MKKKVCVVTGSRAEYGLLYHVLKLIKISKSLDLQLVVTGMHLSPEFGYTAKEIIADGFQISECVEMLLSSDSTSGIGKSIGLGVIGFVDCFKKLRPDIVLVLGDRFEIFSAVTAAMAMNVPIAHISGGDVTPYSIDEQIRHAISKMSHVHFVALSRHAKRLKQMGEEPWRIHVVGEPCIDNIRYLEKIPKEKLGKILNMDLSLRPLILATFHPVTLQPKDTPLQIKNLLDALSAIDVNVIFTYPNADAGGRMIIREIERFLESHPNARVFKSLGSKLYLNLLLHVDAIVGNSSSGIVEAPSFELPAVNIGRRQAGRLIAKNVICVAESTSAIAKGIKYALRKEFKQGLVDLVNPYDKGVAAKKIVQVISKLELGAKLINKKFIDIK